MKRTTLALTLAVACAGPTTDAPRVHVGPVTGLAVLDGEFCSCSQAGVFAGDRQIAALPFRAIALAAVPGTGQLLVGGGVPARTGNVALLSARGEVIAQRRIADDLVYAVAVAADGRTAAGGCADGAVRVFALPGLDDLRTHRAHTAACRAVLFADGARIVSAGLDASVILTTRDDAQRVELHDHTAGVECLALAPDGTIASGSRDGKVRLHDAGGRLLRTYQRLGDAVVALAYDSRRGGFIAGVSDGQLGVLDPDTDRWSRQETGGDELFCLLATDRGLLIGAFGATHVSRGEPDPRATAPRESR